MFFAFPEIMDMQGLPVNSQAQASTKIAGRKTFLIEILLDLQGAEVKDFF